MNEELIDPADIEDDEPLLVEAVESEYSTPLGVSAVEIADICRLQWYANTCQEPTEDNGSRDRWTSAIEGVFDIWARKIEISWQELATRFAGACEGQTPAKYIPAWKAACRQAVNLIAAEDRTEFEEARDHQWGEWVLGQLTNKPIRGETDGEED